MKDSSVLECTKQCKGNGESETSKNRETQQNHSKKHGCYPVSPEGGQKIAIYNTEHDWQVLFFINFFLFMNEEGLKLCKYSEASSFGLVSDTPTQTNTYCLYLKKKKTCSRINIFVIMSCDIMNLQL